MNRNDLIAIAQRLREYVGNPHHVDPMSDAFKRLISDASEALSQAAQPQGEPVAFIQIPKNVEKYGHGNDPDRLKFGKPGQFFVDGKSPLFDFVLLYAEQPAPVAVVLPERLAMTGRGLMDAPTVNHHLGWNACLDEVARLNTK